jgi:hypothetical protein
MKKILDAARRNSNYEIESKVLHEQFYDKAAEHNIGSTMAIMSQQPIL